MRHTGARTALFLALTVAAGLAPVAWAAPTLKGRAVWANPREAGLTEASVVAYVEQLARAHVNTLIMELKTSGGLFWPSERFAPAVVAEYRVSDLPALLIRECHKRQIAFHVWFFDFAEGAGSWQKHQTTTPGFMIAPFIYPLLPHPSTTYACQEWTPSGVTS